MLCYDEYCFIAKAPRKGLDLPIDRLLPSATARQPAVSTSKSHPSISVGVLEEMEFPTQM